MADHDATREPAARPVAPEDESATVEDEPAAATPQDEIETPEPEWWEDARLPWKGKPRRSDIACWAAFSLTGVYALVLLPLRPILLGMNPYLLAALGGSRTSTVTIGALAATDQGFWPLGLVLATFGMVKFDPIYWWAGKLWGRGLIEIVAGRSARAARNAARAERLAEKYGVWAIIITHLLPLPSAVVYATVGAAGMRLRTFLLVDIVSSAATRALYIYLGFRLGQPAVDVVKVIAKYSLWLSLVLLVVVFFNLWRQSRKKAAGQPKA